MYWVIAALLELVPKATLKRLLLRLLTLLEGEIDTELRAQIEKRL